MLTKTTIRNITHVDVSDFGGDDNAYHRLVEAQRSGQEVTVDCEATDGYYDLTLEDGTELAAISWYHLVGFTQESM